MKVYTRIPKVRETDVVVHKSLTLPANINAFREGDIISVTELVDGLQVHVRYNSESDKLDCYNSEGILSKDNASRGFYDYARKLDIEPFKRYENYEFYGEWLVPNHWHYNDENHYQWYLFSIFNHDTGKWMPQSFVKGFATKYQFNYVHELYFGPFLGWDHVYGLSTSPHYGPYQKGVVIKNQTALEDGRGPNVLKYEHAKLKGDACDSKSAEYLADKKRIETLVNKLVTVAEVKGVFDTLVAEGSLHNVITKSDMAMVSEVLPNAVYQHCKTADIVRAGYLGGYFVKHKAMLIVRQHIMS